MAADCTPQTLLASANCILCLTGGQLSAIETWLWCQEAMANCDPNVLLENAKCVEACTTEGQRQAIIVWLLAQIAGEDADTAEQVNALLGNSKCVLCLTEGQMEAVRVWLTCQIAP